eukprot:5748644-Alexandrium_andersonii.AAC.1
MERRGVRAVIRRGRLGADEMRGWWWKLLAVGCGWCGLWCVNLRVRRMAIIRELRGGWGRTSIIME